jgi:hypothetical protein
MMRFLAGCLSCTQSRASWPSTPFPAKVVRDSADSGTESRDTHQPGRLRSSCGSCRRVNDAQPEVLRFPRLSAFVFNPKPATSVTIVERRACPFRQGHATHALRVRGCLDRRLLCNDAAGCLTERRQIPTPCRLRLHQRFSGQVSPQNHIPASAPSLQISSSGSFVLGAAAPRRYTAEVCLVERSRLADAPSATQGRTLHRALES